MKHVRTASRPARASVWTGEPTRVYLQNRDGEWGLFFTQSWGGPMFMSFGQIVEGIKGQISN